MAGYVPQPYAFTAPCERPGSAEQVDTLQHCILPHELFASIATAPGVFEELFGTTSERVEFWTGMARTAREMTLGPQQSEHQRWLREHPCSWVPAGRRVPLGMHGDAGEMQGGEKVMAVSWGGLCRKGSTLDTRLLFCALKSSEMVKTGHATLFAAFKVLAWSFTSIAKGVHPGQDHLGVPFGDAHYPERAALAGKPLVPSPDGQLHGAWCELRGDWEFLRDALHTANYWQAKQVCPFCAAEGRGRGALDVRKHFQLHGPLAATLVGPLPRGQMAWETKQPVSPLCSMPGFSIWRCMFDLMHTLELGLLQRAIPSALQGLMGLAAPHQDPTESSAFGDGSKPARCKAATASYLHWAKAHVPAHSRAKAITKAWVDG